MNARTICLGSIVALMPLSVEFPADTTGGYAGATRARVAGGGGAYAFVARGCEGEILDKVPARFEDIGGSIEHRIGRGPFEVGVRGGQLRTRIGSPEDPNRFPEVPTDTALTVRYVNPYIAIENEGAGIGFGWVFHDGDFLTAGEGARLQRDHPTNKMSAHFRAGSPDGRHFELQWMEGVPLASSGGYLTALAGGPLDVYPNLMIHAGLGAGGPYEGAGLVLRFEHAAAGPLSIDVATRLGIFGNDGHWGASAGIAYAAWRR